jgi:hypothetical protein
MTVRLMPMLRPSFTCLSTDTKPTKITHPATCQIGSTLRVTDSGEDFITYDAMTWELTNECRIRIALEILIDEEVA